VHRTTLAIVAALAACACAPPPAPVRAPIVVDLPPVPASSATASPRPSPGPERPPATVVGRWEGTGHQSDGASWAMQVEIVSLDAGLCATVRYPSIPCASEWICTSASDGASLRARERVTEARNVCLDGDVTMSLTPGGELDWHWTGKDPTGEVTADAVLRRTK
jgi:hypothetical protein